MAVQVLKEADLKKIIQGNKLVIVDFYADWCGPCKQIAPIMDELAKDANGQYEVCKVDVDDDDNREFIVANMIMSIPTVHFYKNGKKVDEFVGLQDKASIKELIAKHV